jgi:hypothetical protein
MGQGHSGSKKVRNVCNACNNGWLSKEIESRAKPILLRLIRGEILSIDDDAQRILSIWAAKIVMTGEYVSSSGQVVSQTERTQLMNTLEPPQGWHIWVGSYGGEDYRELSLFQHAGGLRIPSVDDADAVPHNFEVSAIGIGDALFLVMNSSWPRLWPTISKIVEEQGAGLCRLWPRSGNSISWPRWTILSDKDADHFTRFFDLVGHSKV